MATILIAEDNLHQGIFLKSSLESIDSNISVFAVSSISEALKISNKENIDLFFIDIELSDGSGLELAKEIRRIPKYELTWIVFITAFSEYMLEAFKKIHCYDYIVKPYEKKKIIETAKKLLQKSFTNTSEEENIYLTFKKKGILVKINVKDIIFVEVYKKNCTIHTYYNEYVIKKTSLEKISRMLPKDNFMQSHRSYVVNLKYIKEIKKVNNSWLIYFIDYYKNAFLGETFKEQLFSKIE